MKQFQSKTRGFTLIELLIVVLIIAILAAIAVPNFLEFQIRAKIARAKSDMRTIGVALEAYTVDFSIVPDDRYDPRYPVHRFRWQDTLNVLTTPIAYLSSLPTDPWSDTNRFRNADYKYWYTNREGYGRARNSDPRTVSINGRYGVRLFDLERDVYGWCLISPGPDSVWEWDKFNAGDPEFDGDVLYYDPTNGTISKGDIYLYGSGNVFNPFSSFETVP